MEQTAAAVGERLGLTGPDLRQVRYAALLHDIGKIGIPSEILTKPGPLTDAEFTEMQRHTEIGAALLARIDLLAGVAPLVGASHERWDGGGYPRGVAGEAIPLGARIVCVCDAYDAMTTARPYRDAMAPALARAELRRCAGTQFDPVVVGALLAVLS